VRKQCKANATHQLPDKMAAFFTYAKTVRFWQVSCMRLLDGTALTLM
jgi:hypothetical protein